jgi:hypothetical protein
MYYFLRGSGTFFTSTSTGYKRRSTRGAQQRKREVALSKGTPLPAESVSHRDLFLEHYLRTQE